MFYLFLLAHLTADFVLQPYWLVVRKRRWDGLLMHVGIVLACMLALALVDRSALALWPLMLGVSAVHLVTDRWKVCYGDRIPAPPIVPFLLDQAIHFATLCVALSLALPAARVWSLDGAPMAYGALVVAAYVVAACATPIAVMIWLDPAAEHVALAGGARRRSLIAGAGMVSLTLLTSALALPATLLGLAVVVRRPRSAHPLDRPVGTLAVLGVAAALGALLALR